MNPLAGIFLLPKLWRVAGQHCQAQPTSNNAIMLVAAQEILPRIRRLVNWWRSKPQPSFAREQLIFSLTTSPIFHLWKNQFETSSNLPCTV